MAELVTVYQSQGILGAEVVKAKLEFAGIPCLLRYEAAGLVLGITVDGLGRVEVQVPAQFAADALELIDEGPDEEPEEEDAPSGEG